MSRNHTKKPPAKATNAASNSNGAAVCSGACSPNAAGRDGAEDDAACVWANGRVIRGDACSIPLPDCSVDLVVTSPPYWRKRDYGAKDQIGQEATPEAYVEAMSRALREWWRVLRPTGSVFLNIGDTYFNRGLVGIPGRVATAATQAGWRLRNEIIWAKDRGMPGPAKDRLVNRHESIFHFAKGKGYYYELFGYSERFGNGADPGDVWQVKPKRDMSEHLAPFPDEIAERAIVLAGPERRRTSR